MPKTIDLVRTSKLPSNMMQFAAKGALQVPPDENIEILVYLAKHNKIFGDTARLTLAGWDEKASLVAASDPKTAREVLDYLIAPDNLRPKLLPALLENPSVADGEIAKFAISAAQDSIAVMLQSARVRASAGVLNVLRSNPYLKPEQSSAIAGLLNTSQPRPVPVADSEPPVDKAADAKAAEVVEPAASAETAARDEAAEVPDEVISSYLAEHATEIAAEQDKPFQPVGGIVDLLGADYFPVSENKEMSEIAGSAEKDAARESAASVAAAISKPAVVKPLPAQRDNTMQK